MSSVPLHQFIALNREEIIQRCRAKVATRSLPPPTEAELVHGVPLFLDQLVDALRLGPLSTGEIEKSGGLHGHELLLQGFTVSQVVQDYGDVCQSVTSLAIEMDAPISTDDFRTLDRCLDDAIAGAVTEYGLFRNQSTLDRASARGSERLGFLAHEVRNLAYTAMLAFEALKAVDVGVGGSTGTVLQATLTGIHALVSRSLAEARLPAPLLHLEPFLVSGLIEEVEVPATFEANARDITLIVMPVEAGVAIAADRRVLAAAVGNLLQNALKFTGPQTTVTLRVGASAERVFIEIQDECGGLPEGTLTELFRPFEERPAEGPGGGSGLAYSRWAVEINHGQISARSLPGKGCVFTVDMPRAFRTKRTQLRIAR